MKKGLLFVSVLFASLTISAKVTTLDLSNPTNPESFTFAETGLWDQTYNETEFPYFSTQGFNFSHLLSANSWNGTFWDGFSVSNSATGEVDYYSNVAKGGIKGAGSPYILAYYNEFWLMDENNDDLMSSNHIIFEEECYPLYVYLNNATMGLHDVLEGNEFGARPFAQGDRFEVIIQGLDEDLEPTDEKIIYRLADYTSENPDEWFVNTEWAPVDLTPLGKVSGLTFMVGSTDQGMYGTNTATYFALDGLTVWDGVAEVATFENEEGGVNLTTAESAWQGADEPQEGWNEWKNGAYYFQTYALPSSYYYSAMTVSNETANTSTGWAEPYRSAKGGAFEGTNFAVWNMNYYGDDVVSFETPHVFPGFWVNNTAYAVTSMCNGDSYAKKFEQDDWFKLTITGLDKEGEAGSVDFYLAKDGKYVNEWTYVDLSGLGELVGVSFSMSSSDSSDWGMNTPAYFCLDNFGAEKPDGYVAPEMAEFPAEQAIDITVVGEKAIKIVSDGQVIIIRDGKAFNILGAQL